MEIKQSSIKAFASEAYDKIKTLWNGKVVTFLSKNLLEKPHGKFLVAATLTGVLFLTILGSLKAFNASKANKAAAKPDKAAAKLDEPTAAANLEKIKALEEQKIKKLEEKGEIQVKIIQLKKEIRKIDKNSYRKDKNSFKKLIPAGSNLESALFFSFNYANIWRGWAEGGWDPERPGSFKTTVNSLNFKSTLNSLNKEYKANNESFGLNKEYKGDEGFFRIIDKEIFFLLNAIQTNKDALDAIEKDAKPLLTDSTQVEHFENIENLIEQQTAKKIDEKRTARKIHKEITREMNYVISLAKKYRGSALDRKTRLKDPSRGLPRLKDILDKKILPEGWILEFICGEEGRLIDEKINNYSKMQNLSPFLNAEFDRLIKTYNQIRNGIKAEMGELKQIVEIKRLIDRLLKTSRDFYYNSKYHINDIQEYTRKTHANRDEMLLKLEELGIPKIYLEKQDAFFKASNNLNFYKFKKPLIEREYRFAMRLAEEQQTPPPKRDKTFRRNNCFRANDC